MLSFISERILRRPLRQLTGASGVLVVTNNCSRNGKVGIGGTITDTDGTRKEPRMFSATLGTREEQNQYAIELAAIGVAFRTLTYL